MAVTEPRIRRRHRKLDVTIGTVVSDSSDIRFEDCAGGLIHISTQVTATQFSTTLQLWAATEVGGTFRQMRDYAGSPSIVYLTRDSVNQTCYSLPDAAFSAGAIKLVAGSTHLTSATVELKT